VDYLVPTLTASICHPENWTGMKEKKLEEICRDLAYSQTQAAAKWAMLYDMRHSRPKVVGSNHFFNINSFIYHVSSTQLTLLDATLNYKLRVKQINLFLCMRL
jgi:hypothetical protein